MKALGVSRRNPKDGLQYVLIPAGTFEMGCVPGDGDCGSDEKPRHTVRIGRDFWLGKTEVTLRAYQRKGAGGQGSSWSHPVTSVNWDEAKAFCEWSGGRLPTEAEWEYAARGGQGKRKYPWGDTISWSQARYRAGTATRTGWFAPNGFGLHDMAGNVWEWTGDWYDAGYYALSPESDPTGPATGGPASEAAEGAREGSCDGAPLPCDEPPGPAPVGASQGRDARGLAEQPAARTRPEEVLAQGDPTLRGDQAGGGNRKGGAAPE